MPPDILHFRPLVQFSPPHTIQAQENQPFIFHKYQKITKGMNLTKKKLIPILVLFLSIISILRILSLTIKTTSSFSTSTSPFSSYNKVASQSHKHESSNITTTFKEKEFKVLTKLISLKSPCNILIFGFQPQFLILSSMNEGGNTVFLVDNHDRTTNKITTNFNNTQIYNFNYNVPTKEAYKLLKHARNNHACGPNPRYLQTSKCKLALKNLPAIVYEKNWDVIVVDGPSGDLPESPGRMESIYTASVLARGGNGSDVIVHDVDRMVEKWFSWEFLCDENLLYSKGKLWHFRIRDNLNSTTFCPVTTG
jgi:glucuronoxylan 4-O-methyltransferase